MRLPLATTALLLALAGPAAGQSWRELSDRGEHQAAAAILHPLVLQPDDARNGGMPEVEPTERLARLYRDGLGVPQDRVLACSLATLAWHTATFQYPGPDHPVARRAEGLRAVMCSPLPDDERLDAAQMVGCPTFGPEPRTFLLDGGLSVEISRRRVRIAGPTVHDEPLPVMCFERVALVRHTRIDPAADAEAEAAPRHVVELFSWLVGPSAPQPQRVLMWKVLEIVGGRPKWRDGRELGIQQGTTWFPVDVPPEDTRVTFAMRPDGEIAWSFGDGTTGVIAALPVVAPPDPPARGTPRTRGRGHVTVTVLDRFGSPLAGAAVALTGMVARKADTDAMGSAVFEALPEGRYDLVAWKQGLAPSAATVFDISGPDPVTFTLALKPYGPNMTVTIACGGYDPRTLKTLAAGADLVVHATVTEQTTIERQSGPAGPAPSLTTTSRGNVLQFYKASPLASPASSTIPIQQGGGRIDRGDHVDVHQANSLPPLNVGDEYVLFLVLDRQGSWWIHGAEEGAFRIRNGRVEPLGSGGAATTWKGRSTVTFFDALKAATGAR